MLLSMLLNGTVVYAIMYGVVHVGRGEDLVSYQAQHKNDTSSNQVTNKTFRF